MTTSASLWQARLCLLPGHRAQHVHDATKRHHTDLGLAVINPKGQQEPVPPRAKVLDPGDELRTLAVGCVLGGAYAELASRRRDPVGRAVVQRVEEVGIEVAKLKRLPCVPPVARVPEASLAMTLVAALVILCSISAVQVADAEQGLATASVAALAVDVDQVGCGRDASCA